jgi:hypothetical protein
MNISLQGARRESRMNWDAITERNERAQLLPRRVFMAVVIGGLLYLLWNSFAA